MSIFLSERHKNLLPYTPGEQPRDMQYIKLNTNESPFPPFEKSQKEALEAVKRLNLYSDPESKILTEMMAKALGVEYENVLMTNGSDEILNFAFMAFCDKNNGAVFADITYGFYQVFAEINSVPYTKIPLDESFKINVSDYFNSKKTVFIANPNAPTGIALTIDEIEAIIKNNPNNVVVIDEAYVDFGAESAVPLIKKYKNLLVTQTFSKSRSMAGARLGMGIASAEIIADLKMMKYSTNPYNVNSMTAAAGIGVLLDPEYTEQNCKTVMQNREYTVKKLTELGFECLPSVTNFVFARHDKISGENVYKELKKRGILVRHFTSERISDFNRITVGTKEQMDALLSAMKEILGEVEG